MSGGAVVLLSGGLDSATVTAIVRQQSPSCHALSFDYGQRHRAELAAARRVAASLRVTEHKFVRLGLDEFGGSALTDQGIAVPEAAAPGIPVTYVPARNTIFLACALAWAEVLQINDIYTGINAVDYSGYPDCRPEYLEAFEKLARLATRAGTEARQTMRIHAPLLHLDKAEIIRRGTELGVDYSLTLSCYQADDEGGACGRCDACRFRREGFRAAGQPDPTRYRAT